MTLRVVPLSEEPMVNNELDMVRQRVESANSRLEDGPSAALTSSARAEEKSTLAQGVALCQDTTKGHQALHKPWTTVANLVRKALATDVQDLMKVLDDVETALGGIAEKLDTVNDKVDKVDKWVGLAGPRRKSRSKTPRRNRKRGGGWDNEEAPPAVPAPSSFTAQAAPSRPALPPGAAPPMLPGPAPSHPVPVNRFGIPEATPEALAAAVFRAQQVEAAGLEAIRGTGQIPRGPPDLPTGTEVIEQKCVAYLIGKGGQALAAINAAAGVSIQIDQSTKSFGWSMANIYGTEEGAAKAKMILRQKVSEYRPLRA
ncbi:unnamed protein product [Symbiodinium sp. KB8]|nr:unnamed protein product [Symbiodinium sp. KB8]